MPPFIRALARVIIGLSWMLILFVPAWLCWRIGLESVRRRIVRLFYATTCLLWGIRIHRFGEVSRHRPLLLVSNHSSYLDVMVLGALLDVAFTPKIEVRGWPLVGYIARLCGCVFIDRRPSQTGSNRQSLHDALSRGDIISLFPEGTTSDGVALLPFKSSFFSLAEEMFDNRPLSVQPVTIAYTGLNGKAIDSSRREEVAWVGEAAFMPHILHFLGLGTVDVVVHFHAAVTLIEFEDRKQLAIHVQKMIGETLTRVLQKKSP